MRRPRSGTHLIQPGEIWYYRRVVPKDVHAAFGCTEVVKSLDTTSKIEARAQSNSLGGIGMRLSITARL